MENYNVMYNDSLYIDEVIIPSVYKYLAGLGYDTKDKIEYTISGLSNSVFYKEFKEYMKENFGIPNGHIWYNEHNEIWCLWGEIGKEYGFQLGNWRHGGGTR